MTDRVERHPDLENGVWPSAPAYAAGFMDGEGSIFITTRKRKVKQEGLAAFTGHVTLNNGSLEILQWLQERWGGNIQGPYANPINSYLVEKRVRPFYSWALQGRLARLFLLDILPFLILKRPQAENTLQLLQLHAGPRSRRSASTERYEQELALFRRHRALGLNTGQGKRRVKYDHDPEGFELPVDSGASA